MIDVKKQPEYISIDSSLRLRKYDGQAHLAFPWYQDPEVISLIDGSRELYTLQRIKKMYDYLTQRGEVYFIEVLTKGQADCYWQFSLSWSGNREDSCSGIG